MGNSSQISPCIEFAFIFFTHFMIEYSINQLISQNIFFNSHTKMSIKNMLYPFSFFIPYVENRKYDYSLLSKRQIYVTRPKLFDLFRDGKMASRANHTGVPTLNDCSVINATISMVLCKKDVTPLLMHWSYVFLTLTHRYKATEILTNRNE